MKEAGEKLIGYRRKLLAKPCIRGGTIASILAISTKKGICGWWTG
jgi:hypothetical protein